MNVWTVILKAGVLTCTGDSFPREKITTKNEVRLNKFEEYKLRK